ncbi:MAG: GNAT family N-acetyltransferase [Proteobacteria bacterium]|nr:MAG: GNAT family N-acetyltransferase [Pseudomonadota bacterium]
MLVNSAYRGETSRAGWTTEADFLGGSRTTAELIGETISKPQSVILLAELEAQLVGCVNLERKETACYLGMLTVDPLRQGRALGRALLAEAERYAIEIFKAAKIEMTVISRREELLAWYVRRGYTRTGKLQDFPSDPRFGVLKVSALYLERLEKNF